MKDAYGKRDVYLNKFMSINRKEIHWHRGQCVDGNFAITLNFKSGFLVNEITIELEIWINLKQINKEMGLFLD